MTDRDRERLVYRILAGRDRLVLTTDAGRETFWVTSPTPLDRYGAAEVYDEALREAELDGLLSEDEVLGLLVNAGHWSASDEEELETARGNLDKLKIRLYKSGRRKRERDAAREMLARTRTLIGELLVRRHRFDDRTATWAATIARQRYLVGRCLLRTRGEPVWPREDFWRDCGPLLDQAVRMFQQQRPSEAELREAARTDPWRTIWACRHEGSVFGRPAAELSDDQRALVSWTRLYDQCYEDPERPPDDVVCDDDAFDGWLLVKKQEREKTVTLTRTDAALENEQIANSGEVFIVGARPGEETGHLTEEDREEISGMMTAEAAALKNERMACLWRAGSVKESDMPDSQRTIQGQLAAMTRARLKGG
jgi:hypothetical protein